MSLYTGLIDYLATGEGRTIIFYATHAESEKSFYDYLARTYPDDAYFLKGVEISRGFDSEHAYDLVVSPALRRFLDEEIARPSGMIDIRLMVHFNFS